MFCDLQLYHGFLSVAETETVAVAESETEAGAGAGAVVRDRGRVP